MNRINSIHHFIHHSDSEKVELTNKLCQVYCNVRSKGFRPDIFLIFVTVLCLSIIILLSLCPYWFTFFIPRKMIKRESGEIPEQSRCCEFY